MSIRALKVGVASQAAGIYFSRIKEERGLSERSLMKGVGMTAKSRINRLLTGTGVWTLDDIQAFADYLEIPVKKAVLEIFKESQDLV